MPVESSPTAPAGTTKTATVSAAVQAAVAELVGETPPTQGGAEGAPADGSTSPAAGAAAAISPPPGTPGAEAAEKRAEVERQAAGAGDEEPDRLRELQVFGRAQERWGSERQKLVAAAAAAREEAKRDVLSALASDDPDGELERMGVASDTRRLLTQRMVLRHVPADKATPELRDRIEKDALLKRVNDVERKFGEYVKQVEERQQKERHEATQRQQAERALETLHEAFRSAGDDLRLVKSLYGRRRTDAVREALAIGKEMASKGEISTRMSEADIARKIVRKLNDRYREDFGLEDASPGSHTAGTPPAAKEARTPQKAAEASAARTITRTQTEVTRPPAPQVDPALDEEAWLEAEAKEFARKRRAGEFG